MIHAIEYQLDLAYQVAQAATADEREVYQQLSGEPWAPHVIAARGALLPGEHFTFLTENESVAIGGFVKMMPGVYRTWFLATDSAWKNHGPALTNCVASLIREFMAQESTRRIETITLADRSRTRRWYERIGLSYESTLRGYGCDGRDAVMYVAVRGAERANV